MYTVYTADFEYESENLVDSFDNYDAAVNFAQSIATKPIYNTPDPDGVYVLIYDEDHDSPRYTSW